MVEWQLPWPLMLLGGNERPHHGLLGSMMREIQRDAGGPILVVYIS
jgi:hypothetical protein